MPPGATFTPKRTLYDPRPVPRLEGAPPRQRPLLEPAEERGMDSDWLATPPAASQRDERAPPSRVRLVGAPLRPLQDEQGNSPGNNPPFRGGVW